MRQHLLKVFVSKKFAESALRYQILAILLHLELLGLGLSAESRVPNLHFTIRPMK